MIIGLIEGYILPIIFCQTTSSSVQFSSVTQSCPTLCDPTNRSTPGLLVHNQLPEFTQTHIHRVSDAIQPSHPGSSPSPPAPSLSQKCLGTAKSSQVYHRSHLQWMQHKLHQGSGVGRWEVKSEIEQRKKNIYADCNSWKWRSWSFS